MYVPVKFITLTSPDDMDGAWNPSTSTLDWCEANYVWNFYIAEWWNTMTALVMIFFALHGAIRVHRSGGELRFVLAFMSLLLVGIGTWLFHMTLAYPMQLVDELSMLYGVGALLYCAFEIKSKKSEANYPLAAFLALLATLVSATYVIIGHPVYHQGMFLFMVVVLVVKSVATLRTSPRYWRLFALALAMNVLGFALWNVDVHLCPTLRRLRAGPARFAPALLEFHAWWHVLVSFGMYVHIIVMAAMRSDVLRSGLGVRLLLGFYPVLTERVDRRV